jgi:hypothetical protein
VHVITFAQLEPVGGDDMLPFPAGHAVVEEHRLAVVVLEALAALADLVTLDFLLVVPEGVLIGDRRATAAQGILVIRGAPLVDLHLHEAIALVVAHLSKGAVDRDVVEVRPARADQLGVEVGEIAHLQQRVIGEIDTWHHVSGVEGDLLGLGEEVIRVAVVRLGFHRVHEVRELDAVLDENTGVLLPIRS